MTCTFKSEQAAARSIGVAGILILANALVPVVRAQTLTDPATHARIPSSQAKSQPTVRTKSCSAFGAGFVNIPGTDACIKIGGYVTVEGTARPGR